MILSSGEEELIQDDKRGAILEPKTSEDEWQKSKFRSLQRRAISTRLTQTLQKHNNRVVDCRNPSILMEDVQDSNEEKAVNSFRQ
ncbi:hypothetical protein K1719_011978 [Acacia pycnantha]|nr:hypothetical protein K1719_011978 [Acacia pycnantha]